MKVSLTSLRPHFILDPRGCFVRLHYDPNLRRQMLEKLYAREPREMKKRDGAVIIFKTQYTPLRSSAYNMNSVSLNVTYNAFWGITCSAT